MSVICIVKHFVLFRLMCLMLMILSMITTAATPGPIPDGNVTLKISSTSAVLESYYITAGNSGNQYTDSLVPMRVTDDDHFSHAQLNIASSQTVTITYSSDAPIGQHTNQTKTFSFTPGVYFVSFSWVDVFGPDNDCKMTVQKYDPVTGLFGSALLSVTQKCASYGHAYFRTEGANGILQTVEVDSTTVVDRPFYIPYGTGTFGTELFSHEILCSGIPLLCRGMNRNITIGDYGTVSLNSSQGFQTVTKTIVIPPYDQFVFSGNAFSLHVDHSLVNLPQQAPIINPVPNPAPITYREGEHVIALSGIDNGTPDISENLTITAISSKPSLINNPSVDYISGSTTGTLKYAAEKGGTGEVDFTVKVAADGGTPNYSHDDRSTTVGFSVGVLESKPCDGPPCYAYVGRRDAGIIDVIDTFTNELVNSIPVTQLSGIESAMTPDGSHLFVKGYGGGNEVLSVVSTESLSEVAVIDLPAYAQSLAITPDGSQVYVTIPSPTISTNDVVLVIDTLTYQVIDTIEVGKNVTPLAIAFSPDGGRAYISAYAINSVFVVDTIQRAVIATIPLGTGSAQHSPRNMAVSPDGKRVYVSNYNLNTVSVIDTSLMQVIQTIPVGKYPEGIAVSPDNKYVYVTTFVSAFAGQVEVIDAETNTRIDAISLNGRNNPSAIAITPEGTRAYVAHGADLVVSVIALVSRIWVDEISIGTPTIDVAIAALPYFEREPGDVDRNHLVNRDDVQKILDNLNNSVSNSDCGLACDIDGDGIITVLDARRLVSLCHQVKCANGD